MTSYKKSINTQVHKLPFEECRQILDTSSRRLACACIPPSKATFEGNFQKGQEQAKMLNEEHGIISILSLSYLCNVCTLAKSFSAN